MYGEILRKQPCDQSTETDWTAGTDLKNDYGKAGISYSMGPADTVLTYQDIGVHILVLWSIAFF